MAHYTSNPPALSTAGRAFLYVYVRLWPFSLIYRGILLPHANATSPKSHAPVPPWGTLDGDEKSRTQNPRKPCYARLFFGFWVLRPPSKVPQRGGVVVPPHQERAQTVAAQRVPALIGFTPALVRARRRRARPRLRGQEWSIRRPSGPASPLTALRAVTWYARKAGLHPVK